jgi:hypothetical protein
MYHNLYYYSKLNILRIISLQNDWFPMLKTKPTLATA